VRLERSFDVCSYIAEYGEYFITYRMTLKSLDTISYTLNVKCLVAFAPFGTNVDVVYQICIRKRKRSVTYMNIRLLIVIDIILITIISV
jgi:hypothetical protein